MPGLDPHQRRLEREAQQSKDDQAPPLDPPFPFKPTPFDPWFFGIQNDPPPAVRHSPAAPIDTRRPA